MYIKCNIGRNLELACIFFYWELFQGTLKWPISHTNEHYITNGKLILHCTQATRLTKFVCIIYKKNTFFSIFVENCSIYMYLIFSVCSVLVRKKCIYLKSGTLLNIPQQYPSMLSSLHVILSNYMYFLGGGGGETISLTFCKHFSSKFKDSIFVILLQFLIPALILAAREKKGRCFLWTVDRCHRAPPPPRPIRWAKSSLSPHTLDYP